MEVFTVVGVCDIREMAASAGVVKRPRVWRFSGIFKHVSLSLDRVVTREGFPTKYPSDITRGNRVMANAKIVDITKTMVVGFVGVAIVRITGIIVVNRLAGGDKALAGAPERHTSFLELDAQVAETCVDPDGVTTGDFIFSPV